MKFDCPPEQDIPSFRSNSAPFSLATDEAVFFLKDPGFGRMFTDNMAVIHWKEGLGWHDARIMPRAPFSIDPTCAVLHYAQEIFEGMKAYRGQDGQINLFRPWENAKRFNRSAARMAMPELPEPLFIDAVKRLVRADHRWIPGLPNSLYLRPFMFASEAFLGVRPAREYTFCVVACPAGAYFSGSNDTISVWAEPELSRAGPGGTGAAKCGGNYAASLAAHAKAKAQGCDQVLFLDGSPDGCVEELGGMNLFFVMDDGSLVTPALGTILPGITRQSIIDLAILQGTLVVERRFALSECLAAIASDQVREMFACGTAAVITGVGRIKGHHGTAQIGDGSEGAMTRSLRNALLAIQFGQMAAPFKWLLPVLLEEDEPRLMAAAP